MARKGLPSPEVLRQLFRYDPETGKLFWRERDESWFTATPKRGRSHTQKIWNLRYANQEALTAINTSGYRQGTIFGRHYLAHLIAWVITYGYWPAAQIDHVDGCRTNNALQNLREATQSQNQHNRRISSLNTSGFKGVSKETRGPLWRARISIDGKRHLLGLFPSADEAAAAYAKASASLHGSFGRTQ